MTAWLDNFEGVPHADRDGSESLHVLDSPALSDGEGTSGIPCPTKAVLSEVDTRLKSSIDRLNGSDRARIAFLERGVVIRSLTTDQARVASLEHELKKAHVCIADLVAKLADAEEKLAHANHALDELADSSGRRGWLL